MILLWDKISEFKSCICLFWHLRFPPTYEGEGVSEIFMFLTFCSLSLIRRIRLDPRWPVVWLRTGPQRVSKIPRGEWRPKIPRGEWRRRIAAAWPPPTPERRVISPFSLSVSLLLAHPPTGKWNKNKEAKKTWTLCHFLFLFLFLETREEWLLVKQITFFFPSCGNNSSTHLDGGWLYNFKLVLKLGF